MPGHDTHPSCEVAAATKGRAIADGGHGGGGDQWAEAGDRFALALAKEREWLLLTGDNALRDLATGENVECHGVLWLLDRLEEAGMPELQLLHDGLSKLAGHPRCRLPVREITIRLERYKVTIERP